MLIPAPIDMLVFFGLIFVLAILEWFARSRKRKVSRPNLIATSVCAAAIGGVLLSMFHNHSRRGPPIDFQTTVKSCLAAGFIPIVFAGIQIYRGQVRDYFGGRHFRNESPGAFWFYIIAMLASGVGLILAAAIAFILD